jgi:rhomboid family GlyGly-CTERM serine protease
MGLHQASDAADRPVLRRSAAWQVPLILAAFSVGAHLAGGAAQLLLRYDRAEIAAGEVWRLATGHFAHLGATHLILNLAGLAVVWLLVGSAYSLANWSYVTILSLVGINLGFWFLDPGLSWYVGMSGLLHALLVAGIASRIRDLPGESLALGLMVAGKIAWEQLVGPLPGSELSAGGPVVVNAHLYGAMAGIIVGGMLHIRNARRGSI